jgi:hypothetical protein
MDVSYGLSGLDRAVPATVQGVPDHGIGRARRCATGLDSVSCGPAAVRDGAGLGS